MQEQDETKGNITSEGREAANLVEVWCQDFVKAGS